jgi:hypothetical protein
MAASNKISDCNIIHLAGSHSRKGNLVPIENLAVVPFVIKRVFYIYDIPGGAERGGHAHKKLEQLIIAISGSFDITLDDGTTKKTINLNRANQALYLRSGIWKEMSNFSSGTVCLSLASDIYKEEDYIRDYDEFIMQYGNN